MCACDLYKWGRSGVVWRNTKQKGTFLIMYIYSLGDLKLEFKFWPKNIYSVEDNLTLIIFPKI